MVGNDMPTPRERRAADLAERQHGAITSRQLLALGFSSSTIDRWVARGRLHRRHNAVYAMGHARLSDEGRLWAAFLASGCAFDARTSAWCWKILDPHPDPLYLVAPTKRRDTKTLRFRKQTPSPAAVNLRGLPTLSLEDTFEQLPPALAQRARSNAAYSRLRVREPQETESPLATKLMALIEQACVPLPDTEYSVAGKRRDFAWPSHRLIVEADGRQAHLNSVAFEEDRRRDAQAMALGWRTVRFTRAQIEHDPAYVIGTLRALLA